MTNSSKSVTPPSPSKRRRARGLGAAWLAGVLFIPGMAGMTSFALADETAPPPPVLQGPNPKPQNAIDTILRAFDTHEFVALPAGHGKKDVDDFLLDLIRDPRLPQKVNVIEMECGNALYQPILDRYIAGEDVSLAEVQVVWRDSGQLGCVEAPSAPMLYQLVRKINERLPAGKKLRVLAADSAIDWSKVKTSADLMEPMSRRDSIALSVAQNEIAAKHLKGLILMGTVHLFRNGPIVPTLEKDHPGSVYVIADYSGFYSRTPLSRYSNEMEARFAGWPVPSIAAVKGTWLGNLDQAAFWGGITRSRAPGVPSAAQATKISDMVDAVLYLGPRDLQLWEPRAAYLFLDKDFMAELKRRKEILASGMPPPSPGMPSPMSEFSPEATLAGDPYALADQAMEKLGMTRPTTATHRGMPSSPGQGAPQMGGQMGGQVGGPPPQH
jgi:hypothetical protein